MTLLTSLIDEAHNHDGDPFDVALAAVEASLRCPRQHPRSAGLLMAVRRKDALSQPMPPEVVEQLRALDRELADVMSQLAMRLWDRADTQAVDVIASCVIELPKWIVLRGKRSNGTMTREYLRGGASGPRCWPPAAGVGA
ncbi:hypothetical protein [Mycobacterium lacus]|uniref:Uncharacterized protein n=1 Tax=Mycobacterium lacus TaxID=169765 RepID=A0A1X1XID7_9MYCO|nr:hypothetical protein [Mycobacterium lacus]MCV7124473.1 hypothetical protein [Mycobacterium lacus]ORV98612.1 hypothetical protein AWC15_11300 [Mycobacterium lacus]BBX97298.1 hypothetical protein MLAC_25920 [Mycobacterium lacus]